MPDAVVSAPADSDLALILWDMAQAEHLEESSALASRIQEELAAARGTEGRGVKQAPFRVLVGAAMPAVLVEVAFISNAEEEKLLVSDAYQPKVANAVAPGHRALPPGAARRRECSPLAGGRPVRAVTPRTANLADRARPPAACSLAVALTAPRWARLMRQPVAAPRRGRPRHRLRGSRDAAAPETEARADDHREALLRSRPTPRPACPRTARCRSPPTCAAGPDRGRRAGQVGRQTGLTSPRCPRRRGARHLRHRARSGLRRPLEGGRGGRHRRARSAELLSVYSVVNSLTANSRR